MRETESVVSQDGIRWKPAGLLPLPTEFPASVITSSPILSNSGHSVPFLSRFHHFLTSFLFLSFPLFFSSLFFFPIPTPISFPLSSPSFTWLSSAARFLLARCHFLYPLLFPSPRRAHPLHANPNCETPTKLAAFGGRLNGKGFRNRWA